MVGTRCKAGEYVNSLAEGFLIVGYLPLALALGLGITAHYNESDLKKS
jgi:hypothetical protein